PRVQVKEVRAQGFGPDPFRPYNSQFDPYVYPMGPASPEAGGSGPILPRPGYARANQFQEYLDSLTGTGRPGPDRSTSAVGVPYFRSAVDPAFEEGFRRRYQPNAQTEQSFEATQQLVTEKYLAYFSERDTRKRAALLREYQFARREATRDLGGRRSATGRSRG